MFSFPLLERFVGWVKLNRISSMVEVLNYCVAASVLFLFALLLGAKQQINPISCWPLAHWNKAEWAKYAEDSCYAQQVYLAPTSLPFRIPSTEERDARAINYFKWTPLIALLQAIGFLFPAVVWRMTQSQCCRFL